jgi:hypothetical protein
MTGRRGRARRRRQRVARWLKRSRRIKVVAPSLTAPPAPQRICDIAGCGREHNARGLCHSHYYRRKRRGLLTPPTPDPPTAKPFALVMWSEPNLPMATPMYFATRSEAEAARPLDAPSTVVDISRRAEPRPTIEQVLTLGRGVMDCPYPEWHKGEARSEIVPTDRYLRRKGLLGTANTATQPSR